MDLLRIPATPSPLRPFPGPATITGAGSLIRTGSRDIQKTGVRSLLSEYNKFMLQASRVWIILVINSTFT